jgi:queuosine precursor transporter
VDTIIILGIRSICRGSSRATGQQFLNIAVTQYVYKFTVAVILTPLIYVGHSAAERFLGHKLAHELAEEAARQSGSA